MFIFITPLLILLLSYFPIMLKLDIIRLIKKHVGELLLPRQKINIVRVTTLGRSVLYQCTMEVEMCQCSIQVAGLAWRDVLTKRVASKIRLATLIGNFKKWYRMSGIKGPPSFPSYNGAFYCQCRPVPGLTVWSRCAKKHKKLPYAEGMQMVESCGSGKLQI